MTRPSDRRWVEQAACRDEPTRVFTDPQNDSDVRAALATCEHCPVRHPCLTTALNHRLEADVGIWGGTTETQRRQLRTGSPPLDALATDRAQEPSPPQSSIATTTGPASNQQAANRDIRRHDAPETTVALDKHGDYASADGRVLIFRIQSDKPWALTIDDRFIATTRTATEARRIAWSTLHADRQGALPAPEPARVTAPAEAAKRR